MTRLAADDHRLADEAWIEESLDRHKEGVQIEAADAREGPTFSHGAAHKATEQMCRSRARAVNRQGVAAPPLANMPLARSKFCLAMT